jgi:hypothetical protein
MSATQFTAGLDYDYFQNKDYRFSTGETGSGVSLQGSNTQPLMSALGQKQTFGKSDPSDWRRSSGFKGVATGRYT